MFDTNMYRYDNVYLKCFCQKFSSIFFIMANDKLKVYSARNEGTRPKRLDRMKNSDKSKKLSNCVPK